MTLVCDSPYICLIMIYIDIRKIVLIIKVHNNYMSMFQPVIVMPPLAPISAVITQLSDIYLFPRVQLVQMPPSSGSSAFLRLSPHFL